MHTGREQEEYPRQMKVVNLSTAMKALFILYGSKERSDNLEASNKVLCGCLRMGK